MKLTNKDISYLRAAAHALNPVVIVGGNGITESVLAEIDSSIAHHELIKVRVNAGDRDQRKLMLEQICASTGSVLVQVIGHIGILYRAADKPHIKLPSAS